jgi:hypothetical protein
MITYNHSQVTGTSVAEISIIALAAGLRNANATKLRSQSRNDVVRRVITVSGPAQEELALRIP